MQEDQSVSEMATEALARQAAARAKRTGESLEVALGAVLRTEAGRRLVRLRDGEHHDERADQWHSSLPRERAEERRRERSREERRRLREEEDRRARQAAWESFVRKERRELELRKEGQLAELLGKSISGGAIGGVAATGLRRPKTGRGGAGGAYEQRQGLLQARGGAYRRGHGIQDRRGQVA